MELPSVLVLLCVLGTAIAEQNVMFPEQARALSQSRIVSGWEAEEGQFPFQMSMRMVDPTGGVFSCGATIIHPEWGLTAAHCTAARLTMILRAGVTNLTRPLYIFETTKYYNHPLYDESIPSDVQPNDIGLLEFGRTLEFNELVQPIRLQRSSQMNHNYEGEQLTASGWGRLWTEAASPENLNWVFLTGITTPQCWETYGAIIEDSTICTLGYNDTTQSTCQGDSGGPLTAIDDDGLITQVGVTSFVSRLGCHADMPAGFIRPGHYHGWFTEITKIDFDWELAEGSGDSSQESQESEEEEEVDAVRVVNSF